MKKKKIFYPNYDYLDNNLNQLINDEGGGGLRQEIYTINPKSSLTDYENKSNQKSTSEHTDKKINSEINRQNCITEKNVILEEGSDELIQNRSFTLGVEKKMSKIVKEDNGVPIILNNNNEKFNLSNNENGTQNQIKDKNISKNNENVNNLNIQNNEERVEEENENDIVNNIGINHINENNINSNNYQQSHINVINENNNMQNNQNTINNNNSNVLLFTDDNFDLILDENETIEIGLKEFCENIDNFDQGPRDPNDALNEINIPNKNCYNKSI